jgi:DNA-binding response OmpR family regulator
MNNPRHILLADDDLELLEALASAIEQTGAKVTRIDNGADLVAAIAEGEPIDLIITDVAMPWMSGLQVSLATRHAGIDTPIVLMTALRDSRMQSQIDALGGRVVLLRKPFALDNLLATVRAYLA